MNQISLQEKHIIDSLTPTFQEQGFTLNASGNQWTLPTRNGFRTALITVGGQPGSQTVELNLGIRLDVVEELANQFIRTFSSGCNDSITLLASYSKLIHQPNKLFLIKDEESLATVCKRIEGFMRSKGFLFLERFDRLRKVDGLLNRRPNQPCPLVLNPLQRCFKGLVLAKLTHRTNFDRLVKIYSSHLYKSWAEPSLLVNYLKMVRFLRFYSIN